MIRIWVPGCSTGEEAYSLAILLQEWMEEKIFATDIDPEAIDRARAGVYPASIIADVSPWSRCGCIAWRRMAIPSRFR